eukprot:TRINITY_DN3073_c0_g1_i2.p1 TRINITY_DN3073_c0_g1~~TRINITY_DN3073_c0_g1_i2.p1  ORF type:complete len:383 (-),score=103.40 TRINITY_DN3073_c0_g1_i2:189-1337(-)
MSCCSHGKDFKRSAGGFVHGFRYTARAMHRMFELERHQVPWPSRTFKCDKAGVDGLVDLTMHRMNTASGPYQMIGTLGDAILLHKDGRLQYMFEVPVPYSHEKHRHIARMHWLFGYFKQRQSLHASITDGTKFEIFMWYHGASKSARRLHSRDMLRMIEAFQTDWDNDVTRNNVHLFVASKAVATAPEQCTPEVHAQAERWTGTLRTPPSGQGQEQGNLMKLPEWTAGEVDLWLYNGLQTSVTLSNNTQEMMVLAPGEAKTVIAHDGDRWEAWRRDAPKPMQSLNIDVGMGKVQDMYIRANTPPGQCDPRTDLEQCVEAVLKPAAPSNASKCSSLSRDLQLANKMAEQLKEGARQMAQAQDKLGCGREEEKTSSYPSIKKDN